MQPEQPYYPNQQPMPPQQQLPPAPVEPEGTSKKLIIFLVLGGLVLIILTAVITAVIMSGRAEPTPEVVEQDQSLPLQAARQRDVQSTNNAISQDITSLSDARDFPEQALSDQTLGL
ncbi:hypothetical protein BH23PAT2_BH23PAT2_04160 [soil metagenome]